MSPAYSLTPFNKIGIVHFLLILMYFTVHKNAYRFFANIKRNHFQATLIIYHCKCLQFVESFGTEIHISIIACKYVYLHKKLHVSCRCSDVDTIQLSGKLAHRACYNGVPEFDLLGVVIPLRGYETNPLFLQYNRVNTACVDCKS
jgi:hypothetical protein